MNIPSYSERWVLASHPDGVVRIEDFQLKCSLLLGLEDGDPATVLSVLCSKLEALVSVELTGFCE